MVLHSQMSLVALMPFASCPGLPQACSHCCSTLEFVWQARCKPPNTMDMLQRCSIRIVNKQIYMSAEHSPICQAVHMLPNSRPLLADVQGIKPSRLNNELISQVHKLPHWAMQRLLLEVISEIQEGQWICGSLITWPMLISIAHSHFPWGLFHSCLCMAAFDSWRADSSPP